MAELGSTIADLSQITAIAPTDELVVVDVSDTTDSAEGTNKKVIYNDVLASLGGWISANETWAYASATTITVPSGAVSRYRKGMPFKLTANSVELQGYIVGIADTVLTIVGDTLTNHVFSNNYYALSGTVPLGFNEWFSWTPTPTYSGGSTNPTTVTKRYAKFKIHGTEILLQLYYDYVRGSGNRAQFYFSLPAGITYKEGYNTVATGSSTLLDPNGQPYRCDIDFAERIWINLVFSMSADGWLKISGSCEYS